MVKDQKGALPPQELEKRSLDGISNLKPRAPQPAAESEQSQTQGSGAATNPPATQQQDQDKK